ncbi:MAG: phenylalanine--tRNA ligase subunit alpha [bacterium]
MLENIDTILQEIDSFETTDPNEVEQFRLKYLSKKGIISQMFDEFKNVPPQEKKLYGQKLNTLKQKASNKLTELNNEIEKQKSSNVNIDLSAPGEDIPMGTRHPLSIVQNLIFKTFSNIGFVVATGPEIEDDWHVFSSLNFPPEHPARDMQDTFFIEKNPDILLRTHTSSVQARVMEVNNPPIRIIAPGRVFRNEAISARAHCIFHQVEGLYIDENVSFADLKQTLFYFAKEVFGEETKIRLRPSYFPFTEPSAEMDVSCNICSGKGCNVCKYSGWLEVLGCGMVDPNVLENCGIDSKKFTGYAFGMGIERIAMLKYQINDLRLYFENDVRFLKQFKQSF